LLYLIQLINNEKNHQQIKILIHQKYQQMQHNQNL